VRPKSSQPFTARSASVLQSSIHWLHVKREQLGTVASEKYRSQSSHGACYAMAAYGSCSCSASGDGATTAGCPCSNDLLIKHACQAKLWRWSKHWVLTQVQWQGLFTRPCYLMLFDAAPAKTYILQRLQCHEQWLQRIFASCCLWKIKPEAAFQLLWLIMIVAYSLLIVLESAKVFHRISLRGCSNNKWIRTKFKSAEANWSELPFWILQLDPFGSFLLVLVAGDTHLPGAHQLADRSSPTRWPDRSRLDQDPDW